MSARFLLELRYIYDLFIESLSRALKWGRGMKKNHFIPQENESQETTQRHHQK